MASHLRITSAIAIPESEFEEHFILSSGAGGQNVNKVASAVQLRFDVLHSPSLPDDVRVRLLKISGHRLTKEGVLIIAAHESRDQVRNRVRARERLIELIRRAAVIPKKRKPTMMPRAAKERRLQSKKHTGAVKRMLRTTLED